MKYFLLFSVLFFARTVSAQVFISEIKYTGNEWIEVSNDGAPADLSLWKFYEGGTNHKLKSVQGKTSISSGDYAIIANDATAFLNEYSGFSGILFDSSFSLLDVGETVSIKSSDTNIIDTVSYAGIKGSKDSTQKIGGVWSEAVPTPGVANSVSQSANAPSAPIATNTASVQTTSQVTAQAGPQTRVVLAGAPIIFEGKIAGLENSFGRAAQTTWSFGDGASAEGDSVTHTYYYPGEYTAVLDVVSGSLTATDKMLVRVVLPNLSLSSGGDSARSFFTIQNNGGDELDISSWQVANKEKIFTFPKNTILGARKSATFASEVTGLATPVGNIPELRFPNGTRVPAKVETVALQSPAPVLKTVGKTNVIASAETRVAPQAPSLQEASALNAISEAEASPRQERGLWPWYVGSAFLGALALLGIRLTQDTKQKATINADDFEIIEETDNEDNEEPH